MLYCVQALLPEYSRAFGVSPSVSSLTLSVATGTLALAIIPVSSIAPAWSLTRVMTISLAAAALLGLVAPLAPTFELLIAVRLLQGLALAGLPAIAMAHLSQEVHPQAIGSAMGVLIAGNTIGGLSGRLIASLLADIAGWRAAMALVGVLSVGCLVAFRLLLPAPLAGPADRVSLGVLATSLWSQLHDRGIRLLCLTSFMLMSAFVTVYNYLPYRLLDEPFGLSQALAGLVFVVYLAGTFSSTVAGALSDRFGARSVLWLSILGALAAVLLTLPDLLPLVAVGLVVFTIGFFAAHSVASGWVSSRATVAPTQASAMYLFSYYAGSSIGGTSGGVAFGGGGWPGVVGFVAALLVLAVGVAVVLRQHP